MTDKEKKPDFDPEKDKRDVDKRVFKKKRIDQYGGNPGGKDRDLAGRVKKEGNKKPKEE